MKPTYPILPWQEFGRQLIESLDLDPVYVMLYKARHAKHDAIDDVLLKRFCLAYWMFYSCDTASRIAEDDNFWKGCVLAQLEKWPRGAERRHYRGDTSSKSIKQLMSIPAPPEGIVDYMTKGNTFEDIQRNLQNYYAFGPWITWKIADMAERVLGKDIDFSAADLSMYKEPLAGAALIAPSGNLKFAITLLEREFNMMKAPPAYDRWLNIQEYETILCKYKSHVNGHYPLWKDTREIHESTAKSPSTLGKYLLQFLPPLPEEQIGGMYARTILDF